MVFKKAQTEKQAEPKNAGVKAFTNADEQYGQSGVVKVELVEADAAAISSGVEAEEAKTVEEQLDDESPELKDMKRQYAQNWEAADTMDKVRQLRALQDQALIQKYGEEAQARLQAEERAALLNAVVLDNQLPREASVLRAAGVEPVSQLNAETLPDVKTGKEEVK